MNISASPRCPTPDTNRMATRRPIKMHLYHSSNLVRIHSAHFQKCGLMPVILSRKSKNRSFHTADPVPSNVTLSIMTALFTGEPAVSVFGVFDGHGACGHHVSAYVRRCGHELIILHLHGPYHASFCLFFMELIDLG
jgi:hypothetical protein